MTKLSDIEGIGQIYSAKLHDIGITSVESLLQQGAHKQGRVEIAKKSSINEHMILEWVNRADLARIDGVSTQYADLLEFSGVDSVPELSNRNPENLCQKMEEINDKKHLVRRIPTPTDVKKWVDQAKKLPRVVTH